MHTCSPHTPPSITQQPSAKKKGGGGEEEDEFGDGYPHHVEARPARDEKEAAFPGLRCVIWLGGTHMGIEVTPVSCHCFTWPDRPDAHTDTDANADTDAKPPIVVVVVVVGVVVVVVRVWIDRWVEAR